MTIITERTPDGQAIQEQYDYAHGQNVVMDGTAKPVTLPTGCTTALVTNPNTTPVYARGDGVAAPGIADATCVPILSNTWRTVPCPGGLSLIGTAAAASVNVIPVKGVPS
jgi:hypothetical protein